jgi:5-(carboxyamino)imidazole ribonucleotide synthase
MPPRHSLGPPLVGVLGGGQLGRMLGLAGVPLGAAFRFLDPSPDAGASAVGELLVGALDDLAAVDALAAGADAVTYEWEGVPAVVVEHLEAAGVPVHPSSAALRASQDRLAEKQLFAALGIPTAPYAAVDDRASLADAVDAIGLPAILKTRTGGYDGKGQARLADRGDVDPAWAELSGRPLLLEGMVPFDRELSVLAARGADGTTRVWPLVQNEHRAGILRVSRAPAVPLDGALVSTAAAYVGRLLDATRYIGVVCIELFQVGTELLANEFAPRVHNSGHWTIEGATVSQFEQHVRAGLGWPLAATDPRGCSAMVNCIGRLPDPAAVLAVPGAHLHLYGKSARRGRKVGHITVTAADEDECEERLARVLAATEDDG